MYKMWQRKRNAECNAIALATKLQIIEKLH